MPCVAMLGSLCYDCFISLTKGCLVVRTRCKTTSRVPLSQRSVGDESRRGGKLTFHEWPSGFGISGAKTAGSFPRTFYRRSGQHLLIGGVVVSSAWQVSRFLLLCLFANDNLWNTLRSGPFAAHRRYFAASCHKLSTLKMASQTLCSTARTTQLPTRSGRGGQDRIFLRRLR